MIEARAVTKTYGAVRALDAVSLEAPDGRVTGFVGPNGAGKSTLLRVAAALTHPDSGEVWIDGQRYVAADRPAAVLGVFLSAELIPSHLTATSYLAYVVQLQGLPKTAVGEALEQVGLGYAARRKVKTFSLGMRQRLGIAAAIVAKPRNLILDEPINGLDPDAIHWLREYIRSVAQGGGAVLLSSHHMSELSMVADNVVMIDHGQIIRSGEVSSFVAEDRMRTYFESPDLEAAIAALTAAGFACEPHDEGAVVLDAQPLEVGRVLFVQGPGANHLRLLKRSIEETYFDEISARQSEERRAS